MRVAIVGGLAGGAFCAARLRRLDKSAGTVMVERDPYVSCAGCGLPHHVGGVIEQERSLLPDVREAPDLAVERVPGALHIPLGELRDRLASLPRDPALQGIYRSVQRAHYATRLLQTGSAR